MVFMNIDCGMRAGFEMTSLFANGLDRSIGGHVAKGRWVYGDLV